MEWCRVIIWPDDRVTVWRPLEKFRKSGESDKDFIKREGDRNMSKVPRWNGLAYKDVKESDLPGDYSRRSKWRMKSGKVKVDDTIVTRAEKLKTLEVSLDLELEKVEPDLVKIAKIQRKIQKGDY